MLSNKNYPYIVKSGGLLRGRIHKHDIKNEDTNDSPKDKNNVKGPRKGQGKKKKTKKCVATFHKKQQQLFFLEKKL
jgi:hypothetical protein